MVDTPWKYQEMHMELTTTCNFRCGFCPLVELQRPQSRLDLGLIERILRECHDNRLANQVTFHLMGEALLHPQCMDVLELCRQHSMRTRLVTNGSLYKEDKYRQLFSIVDVLDISYRTVDDMELQSVQKRLTFEQYLDMVMEAVNLRADLPTSRTRMRLRLFISPKTLPSLEALCQRLGVDPAVLTGAGAGEIQPYQEFNPYPWLTFLCEQELDWRHTKNRYDSKFGNCQEYEKSFSILSNGGVTSCCWDAHGENTMGNLHDHSLTEILDNDASRRFRQAFQRHTCPTEKCQKCLARPTWARSITYQALSLVNLR
jgi:radical SAM protein with 4Fe4S-binding SPASM domain